MFVQAAIVWSICAIQGIHAVGCNGNTNFKPWKTLLQMSTRDQGLKTLAAYRGIHGALCPESSTCAALQTIRHGIEAMHIDARADMKGVLWPFADERIGRLTNYVGATRGYFNMRTSPVDGANNPKLKFMHTDVLRGLLLRDIDGKVTEYKATPLEDLLLHIRLHHPSLAVVVQVEFRNELVTLVNILRARGLTSRVAVKFFTEAIGPEDAKNVLKGISAIPIVTGWSLDILGRAALRSHFQGTVKDQILDYLDEYHYLDLYLYMETPAKQWIEQRQSQIAAGPFAFVDNHYSNSKFTLHTAQGKRHRARNVPDGYIDSQGHCCHSLSAWLERSSWIGEETVDELETLSKFAKAVDHITSDIPVAALQYLQNAGHRIGICKLI